MEKFSIRMAQERDAAALLAIYAPYVQDTAVSFEYEVPSLEAFARRVRTTLEKHPYLVAEQNGTLSGYAYASPLSARAAYEWTARASMSKRATEAAAWAGCFTPTLKAGSRGRTSSTSARASLAPVRRTPV